MRDLRTWSPINPAQPATQPAQHVQWPLPAARPHTHLALTTGITPVTRWFCKMTPHPSLESWSCNGLSQSLLLSVCLTQ